MFRCADEYWAGAAHVQVGPAVPHASHTPRACAVWRFVTAVVCDARWRLGIISCDPLLYVMRKRCISLHLLKMVKIWVLRSKYFCQILRKHCIAVSLGPRTKYTQSSHLFSVLLSQRFSTAGSNNTDPTDVMFPLPNSFLVNILNWSVKVPRRCFMLVKLFAALLCAPHPKPVLQSQFPVLGC